MYESVLQGALELPLAQKRSLIERLKGAVLAQMSSVHAGDPSECPRCHHGHVARKGRDGKGRQRWLCRGCGRTFGTSTLGLLAQSKLGPGVWASYVEHMVASESLQRCADVRRVPQDLVVHANARVRGHAQRARAVPRGRRPFRADRVRST